jgi:cell wall-associated NlpC family hydrolase
MNHIGIKLLLFLIAIAWLQQQCTQRIAVAASKTSSKTEDNTTSNNVSKLRNNIVADAEKLINSAYKYGGATPKGFDCSGFTSHVMAKHNILLNRSSSTQVNQGKQITLEKAQPGDLIFFSLSGRIFHVAIVVSNKDSLTKIIHSTTSKGVIYTDLQHSSYWFPKVHSIRDVTMLAK